MLDLNPLDLAKAIVTGTATNPVLAIESLAAKPTEGPVLSSGVKSTGSPFSNFTSWLPYFVLLGGALLLVSNTQYGSVGNALAVLVVLGYALGPISSPGSNWNGIVAGFDNTFGTGLAQSASVPA